MIARLTRALPRGWARRLPGAALATLAFILWSLAFVALYAAVSVGCAAGWEAVPVGPASLQRLVMLAVWALHLALLGLLGWAAWSAEPLDDAERSFRRVVGFGGCALALAATFWTGLPVLMTSSCA
ncbi:hypothetical protein [Pseudoroseomonas cervicalis]|uniref:hypothetical protein n=1 Tax=Teichococcus cervicalis TaxID=204525 RepID=UPI002784DFB7|nr:hypothetical protein [Pseudoroseomonas cervicalis]MDQ1080683.1 hypothetical protein [Pseudoroseomonas cervicalis]